MSLRSLQLRPISTSHYYTSGDVTIQSGVAIAPGVLLQADPNSRIVIRSGACIGIGAILHAHNGMVEVGEGANIGAEVLLVGRVQVGNNACVGVGTTIINSTIASGEIVPPGSLIGDTSRSPDELKATDTVVYEVEPEASSLAAGETADNNGAIAPQDDDKGTNVNVYGQVFVNRMFVKMFPHHPRSGASLSDATPTNGDDPWDD